MLNYGSLMKEVDNPQKCYFIYSYDSKLVLNFIKNLESKILISDFREFNYTKLKFDDNFDFDNFFEVCDTIPMMQEKRIVVLENALFLKREYDKKDLVKRFKDYVKNLPNHCILIVYYNFQDQDKNRDCLNNFSGLGEMCKIQQLRDNEFYREVETIFKFNQISIKPELVRFFCSKVLNDFFHIEGEILKLKFFLNGREATRNDIDTIVSKSFEYNIFTFINNVFNKNLKSSLRLFKELLSSGKDINHIFSMLSNQFLKFLDIRVMILSGLNRDDIIKRSDINKYVLDNFMKLSNKYSLSELNNIIGEFLNIDYRIRTSNNVDINNEIENFIISICFGNFKA